MHLQGILHKSSWQLCCMHYTHVLQARELHDSFAAPTLLVRMQHACWPDVLRFIMLTCSLQTIQSLAPGAGPFTNLGTRLRCAAGGVDAQVVNVDPLAPSYHKILNRHGIHSTLRPSFCKSEELLRCFCPETFDLSIIINALDHS